VRKELWWDYSTIHFTLSTVLWSFKGLDYIEYFYVSKMDIWLEQWSPFHCSQLTFKAF
jgi:hypothetical protein